ncbi:MAG: hypothetical protein K2X02_09095 [Alphaproteobacteria bacterium]|nr:hypothetical protein [Alphaproteobacteria bacterium]
MKIKHAVLVTILMVFSTISSLSAEMNCGEESAFSPMYWKCQTAPLIVISMLTVMEPILDGFTDDDIAQLNAACKENPDNSGCKETFNQVINKVLSDTNKKLPDEIKKNVDLILKDIKQDPLHARFYSKAAEFPSESNAQK